MSKHKTIRCPSEPSEDSVSLRFFLVDLSHSKDVLLRGGRFRKVRVESTRTRLFLCTTFPLLLWSAGRLSVSLQNEGLLVLLSCGMR